MECEPYTRLEDIERIVKSNFPTLNVSYEVSANNQPYICLFKQQISSSYFLNFLPMFYIIGTVNEELKLSLKVITHHGKVLKELNRAGANHLTDTEIMDFVSNLIYLKPCEGVKVLDLAVKLDPYTFTILYLVEQMGGDIIVRSRQCLFVNEEGRTNCDMCSILEQQCTTINGSPIHLSDVESGEPEYHSPLEISTIDKGKLCTIVESHLSNLSHTDHTPDTTISERVKLNDTSNVIKRTREHCKVHKSKVQDGVFKCETCSFKTTNNRNLIRHTKYNHQCKPHSCRMCSYSTASKYSLLHHVNSVHAKNKEFRCEIPG